MTPSTWKNTLTASVRKAISHEPELSFVQVWNFKKEGIASFPTTPRSSKSDVKSYVNRMRKNWRKKRDYAEISQFSPRKGCRRAQILPYSLRFDSQFQNFKKEDTFRNDVQLSYRQDFPRFGRNLDRKAALRRAKKPPKAYVRRTISLEPKLDFPQVYNFKKEGNISFPGTPRTSKTNIGSYVNRVREN